ncbi:MAG TPA: FAD-dependent oxidoreductase, partial [Polyangium sp.]|nr:FAD-dependent oxidoreductase [Polyangium sp.]
MDLSNEADQTLVIIGNGMVSHRLCQRMVEYNAVDDKRVVVFSDEPRPAYDRVHLTDLLSGTPSTNLVFASQDWYVHNGIELLLDDPVVEIDRVNSIVRSQSGRTIAYTRLVIATGAKPFVPQVEVISPNGEALPGVFVYRTVDDVYDIEDRADELLGTPFQEAAVIGGGILGLEAAKAVYDLGLDVHVIEVAPRLMPRQLDADGSAVLREKVEKLGVTVHCGRTLKEVEALPFEMPGGGGFTGLRLTFDKGDPLMVGMLIFAAGVRPRGELADAAGLSTAENGGVVVDDYLQAIDKRSGRPDEQIHAIGDCAVHRDRSYGLVLPGYQMVDVLAANLFGNRQSFENPDASVRLKLMGVSVAALGDYDADKLVGANVHVFNGGGLYRKLIVRNGRLIGAVTIGDWDNLDRIRELLKSPMPLSFWDMRRFRGTGDLWAKSESPPVAEWPPEAVVCGCLRVTRGAIGQVITDGCVNLDEVCARTKAGTICGSCKPLIGELLGIDSPNAATVGDSEAPVSRREGIRSRREVSRSRMDLLAVPRDPGSVGSQRPGASTAPRAPLTTPPKHSSTMPPPLVDADEEAAPVSVGTRVPRQTESPKVGVEEGTARTPTTTATALAAVLRTNSSAPDVKPSPRSLAVLAALHGDFSYGIDEASRKEDTKLRKDNGAQRKDEPPATKAAPATPRTGTVPPPEMLREDAPNSAKQLETALPLIVSGAMPIAADSAISTLTPAAGMVLGPALRAYAASAARVAEMDEIRAPKPARVHAPTPPSGIDLGSERLVNKAIERSDAPTPPTGVAVVKQSAHPPKKSTERPPPASSVPPTPPTGMHVSESQRPAARPTNRPAADQNSRDGSSGTTSNVTVVETISQPPRSKRGSPSVRVVAAEPLSTRTPASGLIFDKSQLGGDTYSQLAIPRSARTGFEPGADTSSRRAPERPPSERRTPTSGSNEATPAPGSVHARAASNRGLSVASRRNIDAIGSGFAASDRPPQSVRRAPNPPGEDSNPGASEFPSEQSRSRSRISLIGSVDDSEIFQVLGGRDSVIPTGDRPPVSRRTWVPPKNLSSAPTTLTVSSSPPPHKGLPSALPPERGRKALLAA